MAAVLPLCLLLALLLAIPLLFLKSRRSAPAARLPPGPWALPVIGHLHHLAGALPHRALRDLARRHGPLMMLRLGELDAVVASSPDAAREIMKTHGASFASRPLTSMQQMAYGDNEGLIFAPYGDAWRQLRKICTVELLSSRRVQSFGPVREELGRLLRSVEAASASPHVSPVNLTEGISAYVADATVRAIVGSQFKQRDEYLKMLQEGLKIVPGMTLPDIFPPRASCGSSAASLDGSCAIARDEEIHGRHNPGAPGAQSLRLRRRRRQRSRGLARRAPEAPKGGRLTVSTHHGQHQDSHAGHVWRRQRDGLDDAAVGDGGADTEPEGDAEGARRGPAALRRPGQGDRGRPGRPALPAGRHQGDAQDASPGASAAAARLRQPVPGARVRRAGGRHGDRERVGDRHGPGALGRARGVRAGAVRAEREGLQGRGLRVCAVRRRAADLPWHGVRAGARGARARGAAVPLRLGAAGRDGGQGPGHDGAIRCHDEPSV